MKIILVVLAVSVTCCSEETLTDTQLTGTWELRHVNGIQIAGMSPDFAPGNGAIYKFNGNEFQQFSNGKLIRSVKYSVVREEAKINNDNVSYRIIYETTDKYPLNPFFKIKGNNLTLYFGEIAADGVEEIYEKIADSY